MLVSSATMTGVIDQLEYRGWVRRLPNPDDRRSVLVEITDAGKAVTDQMLPGIRTIERATLAELTPADLRTLLARINPAAALIVPALRFARAGLQAADVGSVLGAVTYRHHHLHRPMILPHRLHTHLALLHQ
jgi:hypothetical protein